MNNLEISTNPALLGVDLSQSLNTSPSVSNFDEDTSTCPLLPTTPSPPPHFNHPLTPNVNENCVQQSNENNDARAAEEETSSCSGSSDGQVVAGTTTVFNPTPNIYQHLGKNEEVIPESETKLHAHLNLPDSKDVPSFVYWNWKLIRQISFFCFIASVVAMVAVVVSMIYSLPKTCNPKTVWYEGSVFYEISVTHFQDSNSDGLGDFRGLANRVDYLTKLGVIGVRLNSIFPSQKQSDHSQNITTLLAIDDVLGNAKDLSDLVQTFHNNNLSLILDLPIYPHITQLEPVANLIEENTKSPLHMDESTLRIARASDEKNSVVQALLLWIKCGIDGFYIKGLEHMHQDPLLLNNIFMWKTILGPNRILMVSNELLEKVEKPLAEQIVKHVDLVDIVIDVTNGSKQIANQINQNLNGLLKPGNGAFCQWSLGGVSEHHKTYGLTSNATIAATLMSLMLPGSPNVYYGDETSSQMSRNEFSEPSNSKHKVLHHLPSMAWNTVPQLGDQSPHHSNHTQIALDSFDIISRMIMLRDISPSIYKSTIQKKGKTESNTSAMYHENGNILILMRWYPRRNTFVSISNFGEKSVTLDLTKYFYSGQIMVGGERHQRVFFKEFEIGPISTIVIKLDK